MEARSLPAILRGAAQLGLSGLFDKALSFFLSVFLPSFLFFSFFFLLLPGSAPAHGEKGRSLGFISLAGEMVGLKREVSGLLLFLFLSGESAYWGVFCVVFLIIDQSASIALPTELSLSNLVAYNNFILAERLYSSILTCVRCNSFLVLFLSIPYLLEKDYHESHLFLE
ncbi:hypothetical protein ASPZODRAFT_491251 [Penicilliopsis zonata CBS 506.65]|uniref:Uncharacterized protein n=1 Tax=Penicilliopsis zonata CBS 506.65 TaxID=1073090 RepID=A0A1L9SEG5_9EURO|nr:hypothetical protein ASPZODRAFT_491251 [Penicilliopsis zonata CBS 506.65]OJJ45606.1 hypothetical protein ASPZODRAFT_491251 [Penicilliopsis zonata CBS 506.65]